MKVETVFCTDDDRSIYLELSPELLPREGETVQFAGRNMQGLPDVAYVVLGVTRTYDQDTGELVFVFVAVRSEGK